MNPSTTVPAGPVPLPTHLPTLDGLRAIAILLVVPHNLNLISEPTDTATHVLVATLDRGWIGVQLFFVLSGFLITGILLDTRDRPHYIRSFFARRVLRILPLYYATLLVLFVVLPVLGLLPASFKRDPVAELGYWAYFSNWYGPLHPGRGSMSHFWSLAVEEQFYLLWPFLLWGRGAQSVLRLCLALSAGSLLLRGVMLLAGFPTEAIYEFLVARMDALALGGAVAAAFRLPSVAERLRSHRQGMLGASLVALVAGAAISRAYFFSSPMTLSIGYTLLAVGFALLLAAGAAADHLGSKGWASVLRMSPLGAVAKYSYAMYVLCLPLHVLVGKPVLDSLGLAASKSAWVDLAYVGAGTVLCFLAAAASFHLLEVHFLNLKKRPARAS